VRVDLSYGGTLEIGAQHARRMDFCIPTIEIWEAGASEVSAQKMTLTEGALQSGSPKIRKPHDGFVKVTIVQLRVREVSVVHECVA
jgi:hypothetical protein